MSAFNPHVGEAQSGTPSETNAAVSIATNGRRHNNLDVLQLSDLGDTPPECRKSISYNYNVRNSRPVRKESQGSVRLTSRNARRVEDHVLKPDREGELAIRRRHRCGVLTREKSLFPGEASSGFDNWGLRRGLGLDDTLYGLTGRG